METLPNETVVHILGFLSSIKDIVRFGETCEHFHSLIEAEDEKLAKKTYGNPHFKDSSDHCTFHITPLGVLHGRAVLNRKGSSSFAGTFIKGKLHGPFVVCTGENTITGRYNNGRYIGLSQTKFQDTVVEMSMWGETGGLVLMQKQEILGHLVHVICGGWKNLYSEIPYAGTLTRFSEYCEESRNISRIYSKTMLFTKERKKCPTLHRQCCDKHRNGMPKLLF